MTFHFAYCADSSSSQQLSIEERRVIWANTISGVMWFWGATWEAIRDWGRWEHKAGRVLSHSDLSITLRHAGSCLILTFCQFRRAWWDSSCALPALVLVYLHNIDCFRDVWTKSGRQPYFWVWFCWAWHSHRFFYWAYSCEPTDCLKHLWCPLRSFVWSTAYPNSPMRLSQKALQKITVQIGL